MPDQRLAITERDASTNLLLSAYARLIRVIDKFAKAHLHDHLRWVRESLVWKLDGLSDYDVRRPLTMTGTNLLGLVKHNAIWDS